MATERMTEFLRAKAEAYRLMAEHYAAEKRAALLHPFLPPTESRLAHLIDMEASYRQMADEKLAEIGDEAEEVRYQPTPAGLSAIAGMTDDAFLRALGGRLAIVPVR